MNTRNRTGVLAVTVALFVAFVYPASADQALTKKWFPGHYINSAFSWDAASGSHIGNHPRNIMTQNPGFVGWKVMYDWYQLEKNFGVYDFSGIVADLDYAQSVGKKVKLMIKERQFSCDFLTEPNTPGRYWPTPAYMTPNSIYKGGAHQMVGPVDTKCRTYPNLHLWSVAERWAALWAALGPVIDSHPALASISLEESSMMTIQYQPGFNSGTFHNNLMHLHSTIADAFPNTVFTPQMNYRSGLSAEQMEIQVLNLIEDKKGGLNDPDSFIIARDGLPRDVFDKQYSQYWTTYRGIAPFAGEAQNSTYLVPTPKDVVDFVVDDIGVHFMVWTMITRNTMPDAVFEFNDVIAHLNAVNFRINTAPPSSLFASDMRIPSPENVRVIPD